MWTYSLPTSKENSQPTNDHPHGRSYRGRGIAAWRIRWSKVDCESNISDCLRHCFALRAAVLERCGGDKGYSPLSGLQLWATSEVSPCTLAASSCIAVVEYLAYFIHTWDSISKGRLMQHTGLYTHKRIWMDVLLYWSKMWWCCYDWQSSEIELIP